MAATTVSAQGGESVWGGAALDSKDSDFVASFNEFLCSMLRGEAAAPAFPMFGELVPRQQSLRLAKVYRLVHEKVRFVSLLKQQGAEYFGQTRSLRGFIESNRHRDLVILFFTLITSRTCKPTDNAAAKNREFFLKQLQARPDNSNTLYLAVDLDVREGTTTHICRYTNGLCVSHDELQRSLLAQREGPRLACSSGKYLPISARSRTEQLFPLMVSCPCRPSKSERYAWHCAHCSQQILMDTKGMFYCNCGMAFAESFRMICNSSLHREEKIGFWPGLLDSLLIDRRLAPRRLSILVLNAVRGEQIKWMNACLNRLAYPSLREVVQTEPRAVAPEMGNVEERELGFYTMATLTLRVRCACPPTFPLSRSEEEQVFNKLSTLGELNCICVVINSEESDDKSVCLDFLGKLSREAAKNIAFCILDTSARTPSLGAATALGRTLTDLVNESTPPPFCYLDSSPLDNDCSNYPGFEQAEEKWAKQTATIESFFETIARPKPIKCAYLREWRDARVAIDSALPIVQKALCTETRFLSMPLLGDEEEACMNSVGKTSECADLLAKKRQLRECELQKLGEAQQVFLSFLGKCALRDRDLCCARTHHDDAVTPENVAECVKLLTALPIHGDAIRRALEACDTDTSS